MILDMRTRALSLKVTHHEEILRAPWLLLATLLSGMRWGIWAYRAQIYLHKPLLVVSNSSSDTRLHLLSKLESV